MKLLYQLLFAISSCSIRAKHTVRTDCNFLSNLHKLPPPQQNVAHPNETQHHSGTSRPDHENETEDFVSEN